ncbi:MAG: aminotransferase class I/II-fold pyridoxal phosphate-dependent enzyme [Candidatus Pacebacteria bacterium]|nr:aminotransferase class I/II-fold pyridoxal phosphate-dependent enzyme [Candidatus Paceibacterota bacterium]
MIFTSLSPNTERDDVLLALKLRFFPWTRSKTQGSRNRLEHAISSYIPLPHAFAFESGRTSLFAILSALKLLETDEILLQAYTCVAVPEPVLWVGAKPVYVDCLGDFTMDPKDLEQKITSKSRVLIIQHTFGTPAHLEELLLIARRHNLFVIEDCAHALGAEYKGKKVGSFGDASFFSFGRDKVLSSVFGGVLLIKDKRIAQDVRALYTSYPESKLRWVKKQLNHPIIFAIGKPAYSFLNIGKIFIEICKRLRFFSKAVEKVELSGGKPSFAFKKMSDILAFIALHQFEKLTRFNERRRSLAEVYERELASISRIEKPIKVKDDIRKSIYLRYTILISEPSKLAQFLKERGILLGDWYTDAIAPAGVDYEKIKCALAETPRAKELSERSINLPTNIQISLTDALRIVSFIKEFNGSTRN